MIGKTLSHYRLKEQIGAGGMGVVYRAMDEQLERDVAVKVLPAGMLSDEGARRRFRTEALALAKINHPNIATVHEFGNQADTDFLVTEYIPGITLDEKLREGSLPLMDTVRLGSQLALGLSVAHEQGVVHRDLKPGNLRLTPDGRLKILDFGLAQLMPQGDEADIARTLTQAQGMVGTLPYMSPEQLRGEGADSRSDIWAAGAVLYEMATGQRAFPEANSALLCNAILMKDPEPPSSLNPKISPGLENVILKALAKEPGHRYQTARELGVDLDRITAGITPVGRIERRRKFPWVWAGLAAIVLVSAASGYFYAHKRATSLQSKTGSIGVNSGGLKQRRAVAVLGFKNLAGKPELAWLSTALSEMLTTELAAGEQLRTIPGESVAQMKVSLAPPETDSYSKETLGKIRSSLGTDDVVLGSFVPLGEGEIRVDMRMQDAAAGETIVTVSERGSVAHLDELVYRAGAKLREKLGVADVSAVESEAVKASMPSDQEAARYYAEGLGKIRVYDYLGAREYLQKAIGLEANFAPAHIALATAWGIWGMERRRKKRRKRPLSFRNRCRERIGYRLKADTGKQRTNGRRRRRSTRHCSDFFPTTWSMVCCWQTYKAAPGRDKKRLATVEQLRELPAPLQR